MDNIFECQFCGKTYKNMNSLCNHEHFCRQNPNHKESPLLQYNKKIANGEITTWNKGLKKETDSRVAKGVETLKKHYREDWQIEIDDDGKLYHRYINKKNNALKNGLECNLSFQEYCLLVKEAGLKSSDLGFSGKNYVLARYNDTGNYIYGNCRFITQKENINEKHLSDKSRNSSKRNITVANSIVKNYTDDEKLEHRRKISEGIRRSEYYKKRIEKSKNKIIKKDERYCGEHNSQFGKMWITNGKDNTRIYKDQPIPDGWRKGRIINYKNR